MSTTFYHNQHSVNDQMHSNRTMSIGDRASEAVNMIFQLGLIIFYFFYFLFKPRPGFDDDHAKPLCLDYKAAFCCVHGQSSCVDRKCDGSTGNAVYRSTAAGTYRRSAESSSNESTLLSRALSMPGRVSKVVCDQSKYAGQSLRTGANAIANKTYNGGATIGTFVKNCAYNGKQKFADVLFWLKEKTFGKTKPEEEYSKGQFSRRNIITDNSSTTVTKPWKVTTTFNSASAQPVVTGGVLDQNHHSSAFETVMPSQASPSGGHYDAGGISPKQGYSIFRSSGQMTRQHFDTQSTPHDDWTESRAPPASKLRIISQEVRDTSQPRVAPPVPPRSQNLPDYYATTKQNVDETSWQRSPAASSNYPHDAYLDQAVYQPAAGYAASINTLRHELDEHVSRARSPFAVRHRSYATTTVRSASQNPAERITPSYDPINSHVRARDHSLIRHYRSPDNVTPAWQTHNIGNDKDFSRLFLESEQSGDKGRGIQMFMKRRHPPDHFDFDNSKAHEVVDAVMERAAHRLTESDYTKHVNYQYTRTPTNETFSPNDGSHSGMSTSLYSPGLEQQSNESNRLLQQSRQMFNATPIDWKSYSKFYSSAKQSY